MVVVRRRKKSRKLRGATRTHGYGRIGQHRKSGSRGGKGAAGMHKHMWTWVVKYAPTWFGKHGFNRPPELIPKIKGINVGELDELAAKLEAESQAVKENGKIVIDVRNYGFNKVLGAGKITRPLKVITPYITSKAKEKIEAAGGEVVVLTAVEE